jgi:hypothetical protein
VVTIVVCRCDAVMLSDLTRLNLRWDVVDDPCDAKTEGCHGVVVYVRVLLGGSRGRHRYHYHPNHPSRHLLCSESLLARGVHRVQPVISMVIERCTCVYRYKTSFMSLLANSYNFLFPAKTITATSARHRTASSNAFLNNPFFRFRKVTCSQTRQ